MIEERKRPVNATDLAILSILDSNEATTGDRAHRACDFGWLNPKKLEASLEHLTMENLIRGCSGGYFITPNGILFYSRLLRDASQY